MSKNYDDLCNDTDMLKGNINRMCVTDNMLELQTMLFYSIKRIMSIYEYNYNRIELKENGD